MSTATLNELAARLPPPTAADAEAVFGSADPNRFAETGRRVATDKVLTDARRLLGLAHQSWIGTTPEQRDLLMGFSETLLSVAVDAALTLETMNEAFRTRRKDDHTRRDVTAAELGDAWTQAMRTRDRAAKALAPVAGKDPGRTAELAGATGSAVEGADALASGLDGLAALGRSWIGQPALADIVRITRIDEAWAKRLDAAAVELRKAAEAQTTRMTARVEQGDLDVQDGRVLYVLKLIIDVFDEAHEADPGIARLIPSTTIWAYNLRKKAKGEGEESKTETGEGASTTNGTGTSGVTGV